MPELSIIIPVLNEEDSITSLLLSVRTALTGLDYQVIVVDDGSTDMTILRIRENQDERTLLVELSRNYGQSNAMLAGIHQAEGTYIALLDGDGQNDPSDIPGMLNLLKKTDPAERSWDLIAGNRKNRQDGFILRKIPSRIANSMIRSITGVHIRDYGCTLKVMTRDTALSLGLYGEMHRFIPVLAHFNGARMTQVDVKHHPRMHGKSKYGLGRTFKVMSDLLLLWYRKKYHQKPMHFFGTIGLIACLAGILLIIFLLSNLIISQKNGNSPLYWISLILFLGGIQSISLGLIADHQIRSSWEANPKRPYSVRRIYYPEKNEKAC